MMASPDLGRVHSIAGRRLLASCATVYVATLLLVLVLPLWVPMKPAAIISAAYLAGFNTKVADLAAAAIACIVCGLAWRGRLGELGAVPSASRLGWRFIAATILLLLTALSFACWIVTVAQVEYHADAGYFREQLLSFAVDGRHLYTQLDFPYGPLMMLLPAAIYRVLHPFHVSVTAAYFVSLILAHGVGMLTLGVAMNLLPMRAVYRRVGFVLLCAGSCVSLLGLNYTYFRFVPPLLLLLWVSRLHSRSAIVAALTCGALFELSISPEVGLAFLLACWAYGGWAWRRDRLLSLLSILLPSVAAAILLLSLKDYLALLVAFGQGAYNFPLIPVPSTLIFLFALSWLVPRYMGLLLREPGTEETQRAIFAALFGFCIGMIPSTFGRCDPLHIFFDGTVLLVLSLAAASRASPRAGALWLGCVVVLVGWMQFVHLRLDQTEITDALREGLMPRLPASAKQLLVHGIAGISPGSAQSLTSGSAAPLLDLPRLESFVGHDTIATPDDIDWRVEEQLRQSGHFRSDFFCYTVDVRSAGTEERKDRAMDEATWALLPYPLRAPSADSPEMSYAQGIGFGYPMRNRPLYYVDSILHRDLEEHWHPVADFGAYRLYKHLPPAAKSLR